MKVLLPIRSAGYMEKGGSTNPWKIITINPEADEPLEVPYVLKLFTKNQVSTQNSIGKEFLGNYLTSEFDLVAPECGLVTLDPLFLSTIEKEQFIDYQKKYHGFTFACRLIEGAFLVNENIPKHFPIKEYANIFAFDCLIMNTDRGGYRKKPNLLMNDEGFKLIDHELIFQFSDSQNDKAFQKVINNLKNNTLGHYGFSVHIFYNLLKHYGGPKRNLFDDFSESLKNLNMNQLRNHITQLEKYDVSCGTKDLIIDYLAYTKQNPEKFAKILQGIIS